jgi:hypothetical protein
LSSSAIHVFTTIGCTEATIDDPGCLPGKGIYVLEPLLLCRWNYHEAQSCVWKSMTSASSIEPGQERHGNRSRLKIELTGEINR